MNKEDILRIFNQELLDNGGHLAYDMTNDIHRAVYFHRIGLEEQFVKEKYPHFYKALTAVSDTACSEDEDMQPYMPHKGFASIYKKAPNYGTKSITSGSYPTLKSRIYLNYKLIDSRHPEIPARIANPVDHNVYNLIHADAMPMLQQTGDGKEYYSYHSDCTYTARSSITKKLSVDQFCSDVIYSEEGSLLKVNKPVHPAKLKTGKSSDIVLLYNRTSKNFEDPDYEYENVDISTDENNVQSLSIHLLSEGTANIIEEGITFKSINYDSMHIRLSLRNSQQGGYVEFNTKEYKDELTKLVWIDEKDKSILHWDFHKAQNWKSRLKVAHVDNNTTVEYNFCCDILVQDEDGGDAGNASLLIKSSNDTSDEPSTYYIPYIFIWWGCIGKGGMVSMADHTTKKIEEICIGDCILGEDGKADIVRNVITGLEESLIFIRTYDGEEVRLTDTHPIKTERGWVPAAQLHAGDRIVTLSGIKAIETLDKIHYEDTVYNLLLTDQESLYCGGILVGDAAAQNRKEETEPVQPDIIYPPEEDLVDRDMDSLSRYLQQQNSLSPAQTGRKPYFACSCEESKQRYATICSQASFQNFTLDVWVYPKGNSRRVLSQDGGFSLGIDENDIVFSHPDCGEFTYKADHSLSSSWQHIFVALQDKILTIGLNGTARQKYTIDPAGPILMSADIDVGRSFTGFIRRALVFDSYVSPEVLRRGMFENSPFEETAGLIAFLDMSSGSIRNLAPNGGNIIGHACLSAGNTSNGLISSPGSYAAFNYGSNINPGGFSSHHFTLHVKLYTTSDTAQRATLLANGRYGDPDAVIVYSENAGDCMRTFHLLLGKEDLTLTPPMPYLTWIDLAVVYDNGDHTITSYVNGGKVNTLTCKGINRTSPGCLIIGNGFCDKEEYPSDCAISSVSVFNAPLTTQRIESLYQSLPFVFEKDLVALYNFEDDVPYEMVSRKPLNVHKEDIEPICLTTCLMSEQIDRYKVDIQKSASKEAETFFRAAAYYFKELFGLETELNKSRYTAVCHDIDQHLLTDPIYQAFVSGSGVDKRLLKRVLRRFNTGFTSLWFAMTFSDTANNRDTSDLAHKVGANSIYSAASAVADCTKALCQNPDQKMNLVLDAMLEFLNNVTL